LWFTYYRNVIVGPEGLPAGGPGFPEVPVVGRMTTDGELTKFFSEDNPNIQPNSIVRGPEDNLWFTTEGGGIWRINLAGTLAQVTFDNSDPDPSIDLTAGGDGRIWYTLPMTNRIGFVDSLFFLPINLAGGQPIGLARGQDDSIWFADYGGNRIGRIDKNGSLQQFEIGDDQNPTAVAVAPDGSAWFTNPGADAIGHITTDGDVAAPILIPNGPSNPQDIVFGPDGNFWFTEYDAGAIGRVTPQGVVKRFPIPHPDPGLAGPRIAVTVPHPLNITVGPDGNLWFTDEGLNKIGRITTSGDIVEFPIPTADSAPAGITAGNGKLYFVEANPGRVACITTDGDVTELGTPDPEAFPQYITLGPDGAIWFTETTKFNRFGRRPRRPHHPFRPARHRRARPASSAAAMAACSSRCSTPRDPLRRPCRRRADAHDHTDSDSHANPYAHSPYRRDRPPRPPRLPRTRPRSRRRRPSPRPCRPDRLRRRHRRSSTPCIGDCDGDETVSISS
jgi:streptogramin lyase